VLNVGLTPFLHLIFFDFGFDQVFLEIFSFKQNSIKNIVISG